MIIGLPPLTNGDSDLIADGWEAPGLWLSYVISRGLMVATRFTAWHPWRPPLPTSPRVLVLVLVLVPVRPGDIPYREEIIFPVP